MQELLPKLATSKKFKIAFEPLQAVICPSFSGAGRSAMAAAIDSGSAVEPMVQEWLSLDTDADSRAAVGRLVAEGKEEELQDIMGSRLEFGELGADFPCPVCICRPSAGTTATAHHDTAHAAWRRRYCGAARADGTRLQPHEPGDGTADDAGAVPLPAGKKRRAAGYRRLCHRYPPPPSPLLPTLPTHSQHLLNPSSGRVISGTERSFNGCQATTAGTARWRWPPSRRR